MLKVLVILLSVSLRNCILGAPVREEKQMILFAPPGFVPPMPNNVLPHPYQTRGPLDFIGNWIQSSDWFPIEINVPDTFQAIGSGVGNFAQNVGNGWNDFSQNFGNGWNSFTQNVGNGWNGLTQNVGDGWNTFTQNLAQRFPVIANINRPHRYFVLVPVQKSKTVSQPPARTNEIKNRLWEFNPFSSSEVMLPSFP